MLQETALFEVGYKNHSLFDRNPLIKVSAILNDNTLDFRETDSLCHWDIPYRVLSCMADPYGWVFS